MAEFPTPKDIQSFQAQVRQANMVNNNVIPGQASTSSPAGSSSAQQINTVNSTNHLRTIMDFKSVDEYSTEGLKRIIEATRAFQLLPPSGPLWDLQKSYPEFSRAMKNCRTRILPILKTLLQHAKIPTNDFKKRDLEEKFEFIVEANDDILERIATALDEATGLFKRTEALAVNSNQMIGGIENPNWNKRPSADHRDSIAISNYNRIKRAQPAEVKQAIILNGLLQENAQATKTTDQERPVLKALHRLRVTEKPQIHFKVPVDNSLTPFAPKLKEKPNSIKPLSILPEYNSKNEEFYGHPYNVELNRWEPDEMFLQEVEPQFPVPTSQMPFTFVATKEELDEMMKELREVNEIGVDVEHHAYRTFLGLTCTVQISTRKTDYVIDALALREELEILNEVFTKPKVMKVIHGAQSDIEWLQRDFGVYIVGLFDTHIAAKQIGLSVLSLQYLLQHYCKINVDKTYQLADWRIRPLPIDMVEYSRQDTHYLLYLYDVLKNELIKNGNQFKNLLTAVYDRSRMICLKRYEKPSNNPQLALRKTRRQLNNRQLYAFTELFKWRDALAREKDESLGFILPNHMLLMIAESLPKEMTGILACCDPVPPMVQNNLGELHRIILQARDLPLHEEKVQLGTTGKRKKLKSWVVMLNSILDVNLDEIKYNKEGDDEEVDETMAEHPTSTTRQIFTSKISFPEVWDPDSIDLSNVKIKAEPSSKMFGPRLKSTTTHSYNRAPSGAFQRYQLSNEIVQMLKDPKKKEELDLEDPLVRVVYDTLVAESEPLKLSNEEEKEQRQADKVLPDSEFVPFNPMAQHLKSLEPPAKKKKNKKTREEWNDGLPYETPDQIRKDFVGAPIAMEEDADEVQLDGVEQENKIREPNQPKEPAEDDEVIVEDEEEESEIDEDELFGEIPTSKSKKKKGRAKYLEQLKLKKLMKLKRQKKHELAALEQEELENMKSGRKGNRGGSPEIIEIDDGRSPSPPPRRIAPKLTPSPRRSKRGRGRNDDDDVICLDDDEPPPEPPTRRRKHKERERDRGHGGREQESTKVLNPYAVAPPQQPDEPQDMYAGFMQRGKVRADSTYSNAGLATVKRRASKVNGNNPGGSGAPSPHINPNFLPPGVAAHARLPVVPMPVPIPPRPPPGKFLNQFRRVDGKSMTYSK